MGSMTHGVVPAAHVQHGCLLLRAGGADCLALPQPLKHNVIGLQICLYALGAKTAEVMRQSRQPCAPHLQLLVAKSIGAANFAGAGCPQDNLRMNLRHSAECIA